MIEDKDEIVDNVGASITGHLVIKDKETGEILLNRRDTPPKKINQEETGEEDGRRS